MAMSSVTVRVDEETKRGAARVAEYYGFDLSSVTRAFWKQMVREDAVPLTLRSERPNEESLEAIRETEEIIEKMKRGELPTYASADEMFDEFLADLKD